MRLMNSARHGFTIIELLVVVSILSVLVALLLPSLTKARDAAITLKCLSHVSQLTTAELMYGADNKQWYTPGWAYADLINEYIGIHPSMLQQGTGGTYLKGAGGYPFKCPLLPRSYGIPQNGWNAHIVGLTTFIPRQITCLDYGRNSGLHGTEIASPRDSNLNMRWRREHQLVTTPSRVLNYGCGAGSIRIDYSQFGLINRHNNGWATNISFADGHAITWGLRSTIRDDMNYGGYGNYSWY
jgi:prepilin-type N-terminal cleavage/methylation domain-containing protein/prepilin-type processing-associated H-X9-DG protein